MHPSGRGEKNALYTVMGTKGGVGTTLLTCALAAAMSSSERRVLLMEMDRSLSQLLYLKPRGDGKSLLDLYPMAEEISWDLIKASVHRHMAGFHLLPYGHGNDDGVADGKPVPEPLMRNLLFLFDVIIQDLPCSSRRDFIPLLHYCPTVLLVSLPDTLSATCARSTAAYVSRTGLCQDHLRLVVNRCGPHHALEPVELARAVGIELLAAFPDDPRSGLDFAELGELPRNDSPLGKAAAAMAAALGFGDAPTVKAPTLQLFKRLRGRSADTA
jgi:MinD-like ATPase involved in chromosome partitioning or flagellar assembly